MVPDHTRGAHPTVSGPRYVDYAVDPAERERWLRRRPCGTCALMTQTTLRNGGVVDAVDPADFEETLLQLGLATSTSRLSGLECGTTPAGALDHEELFGIERERRPVLQIADSSAPSAGKCNFFTFASSSFGKSWTSFL